MAIPHAPISPEEHKTARGQFSNVCFAGKSYVTGHAPPIHVWHRGQRTPRGSGALSCNASNQCRPVWSV